MAQRQAQEAPEAAPGTNWARREETEAFARTVRLFRQGRYDEDSFRRFRLQHGAYGTRMTGDYAMVRIKVPAGRILPAQLERIAQLCERFSIGSAHVSTRENVQLHWVILEDVSEVFRGLAEVGLTSREACGNTVRNVMCSPLSGVCAGEAFDATPYALATARFLLRNPLNQNLPRKFKFNFTCCEEHGMVRMVDVGVIPQVRREGGEERRGFRVFLGGGLGNRSFVGHELEEFTPEEDLLHTSLAVLRIFDRLGDRKNLARNRMRYLVNDMGWEAFRSLVLKERAIMRATQSVTASLDVDTEPDRVVPRVHVAEERAQAAPDGYARWLRTCTFAQKQEGYRSVFVALEAGDITASQLRSLARICRAHSGEGLARMGFTQNVALRHVREDGLAALYADLLEAGLARPGALTMAAPIGCSGTTSCNLALTNSHRLAKELQRKFTELGLDDDDALRGSSIKISGCPNSCGQHGIATVGLYGGGARSGKSMYPVYQMSLGGRSDGETMLGVTCMRVPAKRAIQAILELIEMYRSDRQEGDSFRDWIHKIVSGVSATRFRSVQDVRSALSHLAEAPSPGDDADFFSDYGSDGGYHAKTGRGECAA
ncbi:MAG: nitrite/sulfite reductase [Thaumarchaeota archaeon]|nr:nitrite/sulfite reductase [Nitrososphaerota archaeon]MDD9826081.1 nitrite/sulfite reductase [Nitrososphaerota archaeon]MDD9843090.1 nitrite/sulfite reductase [Nitrososphaerota archaeon]